MKNFIQQVREEKNISRAKLAELMGVYPQLIYRLERKDSLDLTMLLRIAVALNVAPSVLVSYADEFKIDAMAIDDLLKVFQAHSKFILKLVPILDRKEVVNYKTNLKKKHDFVVSHKNFSDDAYAVLMDDKSMEPRFMEGDICIVDPDVSVKLNDFCMVTIDRQKASLLRFVDMDDDHNYYNTLVENSGTVVLPKNLEAVNVLGKVVDIDVTL